MGKWTIEQFAYNAFTVFNPRHRVIARNIATLEEAKSIIAQIKAYDALLDGGSRVVWEEEA